MMKHLQNLMRFTALALCALLTAACFGGSGSAKSADESHANGMASDAGKPKDGGTYTAATPSDAKSLDPQKQSSFNTHVAVGMIYSKLVDFKTGPKIPYGSNDIEGDLADTWEHNADATQWTFKLRKGVKWHNKAPVNGREFKAADVVCTLERIKSVGFQKYLIKQVASVDTPDDYTVVFNLSQPVGAFDLNMANHYMEILPCEATQGQVNLDTDAIGTGPFMLESWTKDQERVYTKNPDYFIKGEPHLDKVVQVVMPDAQAQIAALRSGKIDFMSQLSTDKKQVDQLLKEIKGLQIVESKGNIPVRLFMNQTAAPFDNLKVRQAVSYAIDRSAMRKALRFGGQSSGPITPLIDGALSAEEVDKLMPFDPKKSTELLKEAGYPDGFEVKMSLTNGYGETVVQEAQWVQQDLAKVGIKVTLDIQDYATYFTDTFPNKKYAMGFGLQTPMLTADEFLSAEWYSTGPRNWYGINDPQLDKMIDEHRATADKKEREKKLKEIQEYIIKNISNPLTMYTYDSQDLYAARVHNVWTHPDYGQRHMKDVWVDQ